MAASALRNLDEGFLDSDQVQFHQIGPRLSSSRRRLSQWRQIWALFRFESFAQAQDHVRRIGIQLRIKFLGSGSHSLQRSMQLWFFIRTEACHGLNQSKFGLRFTSRVDAHQTIRHQQSWLDQLRRRPLELDPDWRSSRWTSYACKFNFHVSALP